MDSESGRPCCTRYRLGPYPVTGADSPPALGRQHPDETAKALADGWFHTGDGGYTEGPYLVIADRKKDVIITGGEKRLLHRGGGLPVPASGGRRSGGGRRAGREVGRGRQGARGLSSRRDAEREGADRLYPQQVGAFQMPDLDRDPRGVAAYRHRQAAEVQAAGAVPGRQDTSREWRAIRGTETIARRWITNGRGRQ